MGTLCVSAIVSKLVCRLRLLRLLLVGIGSFRLVAPLDFSIRLFLFSGIDLAKDLGVTVELLPLEPLEELVKVDESE
jgi:hypothetical protein